MSKSSQIIRPPIISLTGKMQKKLAIGARNGPLEREAGHIADKIGSGNVTKATRSFFKLSMNESDHADTALTLTMPLFSFDANFTNWKALPFLRK